MANLKLQLYKSCLSYVEERISISKTAIEEAQGAANAETKSTAGDKHDTARAMMQLEVEKNMKQLAEAQKLKQLLAQIDPKRSCIQVEFGAAAETTNGNFYVCISAGKIDDGYFAISPVSPIGLALRGCRVGDSVSFNGKTIEVLALH
ncbi:3-oxoacyl-ACP synthase [Crocinitomix catalasitica]|nr:3-oxoacyl-ACP synthase [Crocinitomix catalasitica]